MQVISGLHYYDINQKQESIFSYDPGERSHLTEQA